MCEETSNQDNAFDELAMLFLSNQTGVNAISRSLPRLSQIDLAHLASSLAEIPAARRFLRRYLADYDSQDKASSPADVPPGTWAEINLLGHHRVTGVFQVVRWGESSVLLVHERGANGWQKTWYGPSAVYSIRPLSSEEIYREENDDIPF